MAKCPDCGGSLVFHIRYGKDTGNWVCETCWHKFNRETGERVYAKKPVRYRDSLKYRSYRS